MANALGEMAAVHVDSSVLAAIAAGQGSPFYIADTEQLQSNLRALLESFRTYYPVTSVGYSYKTNYSPAFIRCAHNLGAYAEVVSRLELDLAIALGVPGSKIIFNGPIKTADDLTLALRAGARVNIDSLAEARLMAKIARSSASELSLGIRCNLGPGTPGSRFGVDLDTAEGKDVIGTLDACPNVRIRGLHCHYCGDRNASGYRDRIRHMIRLHATALGGRHVEFFDIGGGFSSRMSPELAAQFTAPPSSFHDYAAAIAQEMASTYGATGPELILEPGMGVLADTMTLVTRVQAVKRLQGRNLAVVDGSVFNIKPLRGSINLPIVVVQGCSNPGAKVTMPVDVVGHTCMEVDVLHTGYAGAIGEGDWVIIPNVGAYTNVLNAPFIRGTPAIVELRDRGNYGVLRRASTLDDLLATYRVDQ
ncbi:MAG: diaminopimelate decarboxylase [Luteitalea sp.]|nr:diaminopimelate decarboxylase [Luteitalea sp.]